MADHPTVIFDLIWDHLSYEDVLALRSTCKDLKLFVDAKCLTKLNLFVRKFPYRHRLFYTGQSIGYPQSYRSDNLATLFASGRFRDQFSGVQRMIICTRKAWKAWNVQDVESNDFEVEFDLNHLNCFGALEHLEIDGMHRIDGKLNLLELRIAAFRVDDESNQQESSFELDCPKLSALRIKCCKPVLSDRTNQLDQLHCENFSGRTGYLRGINENLQMLSTIWLDTIKDSLQFIGDLTRGELILPRLTEIQLERCNPIVGLSDLADGLRALNRNQQQIRFVFNGRPVQADQLNQIVRLIAKYNKDVCETDKLNLQAVNDRSLLFLNGDPELDFLLSAVWCVKLSAGTELSEALIRKLVNVECLELASRCKVSESALELLARTCRSLRSCSLHYLSVTERVLESMCDQLENLEHLRLHRAKTGKNAANAKKKPISLKALANFANLVSLDFNFVPEKEELTFLFEKSRTLESVSIVGKNPIKLQRTFTATETEYRCLIGRDMPFDFKSLTDLIEYHHLWRLLEQK